MEEWFIIFSKNVEHLPWFARIAVAKTPPEFRHVYLCKGITNSHLLLLDPNPKHLRTDVIEVADDIYNEMEKLANYNVVLHTIREKDTSRTYKDIIPTCVSVSKYILGLDSKAITPYGLYKDLMEAGAVEL